MKNIKQALSIFYNCKLFGLHEWTCKAQEGIKSTDEELYGGLSGFKSYAQMYCKRCGEKSKLTL